MAATKTKPKKEAPATTAPVRAPAPTGLSDTLGRKEEEGFFLIDLTDLVPSPTNPRKHFDAVQLAELSESLKSKGMVQPIVVRPHATKGRYEIVAGERRYRAAQLAAMLEVPCIVRNLSDRETLEIQCIENEQRADVSPMERARAYRMLRDSGYSNKQIAEKVGTSEATVREIDALNRIPLPLIKALDAGKISRSVAAVVARVPNEAQRAEAAECVLLGCEPSDLPYFRQFPGTPLNLQRTQDLIVDHFTRELKGAPFNPNDEKLLPEAGSCKKCPKRAGNNREEYPEGRADLCNDVACFREKVQAHKEALRVEAMGDGYGIAMEDECKEIFPSGNNPSANWIRLDHQCDYTEDGQTWQYHFTSHVKQFPKSSITLAFDQNGFPYFVANRRAAWKWLRDVGIIPKSKPKPDKETSEPATEVDTSNPPLIDTVDTDGPLVCKEALTVGEAARILGDDLHETPDQLELLAHTTVIQCLDLCETITEGEEKLQELIEPLRGLFGNKFRAALNTWGENATAGELLRVLAAVTVQRCEDMTLPYDTRSLVAFAKKVQKDNELEGE